MTKARERYFEISPGWAGGTGVGLRSDGWLPLTTGLSIEATEARYGKKAAMSSQFMFKKRPNTIPDLVFSTGDVPIVTAPFKSVVETTAPGEAEFQSFTMRWPDEEPVAGDWYLMNVLNLIDCFDFERMGHPRPAYVTQRPTGESMTEDEIWWQARLGQAYSSRPFYIDPKAVGAVQIWRPFFKSKSLCCTGQLLKALKKAGVKRLHAERLGTRDDPLREYDWAALGVPAPGGKTA